METVESRVALRDPWSVQQVPRLVPAVSDSGSHRIGLITLDVKGAGARSAGNPLATCDVAGVGNGIFTEGLRASARPYQMREPQLARIRVNRKLRRVVFAKQPIRNAFVGS
jgi:hypothetical protein